MPSRDRLSRFQSLIMPRYDYNLVAIGAGAGGLVTTLIGAMVNAKVTLIEKHRMGGDCLNTGCVPSKSLIASSKVVQLLKKHEAFGLRNVSYEVDFPQVMEHIQGIIAKIAPHDSVERFTELGVECHLGEGRIRSPHEVEVNGRVLTTKNIIVSTGARPFVPPIPGLDQVAFSHSDNLWELRKQPKHLVVIGGGPIGCELAQAFRRLGSEVTMLHLDARILPREDADVVEFVSRNFELDGITIHNSIRIQRVERTQEGARLHFKQEGREQAVEADHLLVATGRKANTAGFGLEELGVALNPNGTIKVDRFLRSSIPNVFACGDVASPYQFTHMAGHQAWFAAVNALFSPLKKFAVDYSVVPWCTYTDPEVARVGLSEEEAQAQGVPHEVTCYGMDDLDRAITDRSNYGIVKVLTPPAKDRILGATICSSHAGDLLAEFVLAMKHGLGLKKILGTIHSYPTLAEANKLTAGVWRKHHAPQTVLNCLERFHAWRRW